MCLRYCRVGLLVGLTASFFACTGETDRILPEIEAPEPPGPQETFQLSGSTGALALTGADLTVVDRSGDMIVESVSDQVARFSVDVPVEAAAPVRILATGGEDLVTGRSAAFEMSALAFSKADQNLHVSPLSTLTSLMVECTGAGSEQSLASAQALMASKLSMGLDPSLDGLREPIDVDSVADLMLANQGLREVLRRSEVALSAAGAELTAADILRSVACDLALDGEIDSRGGNPDGRVISTFKAAELAVLAETLAGELQIDGADGAERMNAAIASVFGIAIPVASVEPGGRLLAQAESAVTTFLPAFDDDLLKQLAQLTGEQPASAADEAAALMSAANSQVLSGLAERVALADPTVIGRLETRMAEQVDSSPPAISLALSRSSVTVGDTVTVSWAAAPADLCWAEGVGWTGEVALQGSFTSPPLTRNESFELRCLGAGGSTTRIAQVTAGQQPAATITSFVATPAVVQSGQAAQLSWRSEQADVCVAELDWSGNKPTIGSESTGALTAPRSYRLVCSGPGGSDQAGVTVAVNTPPPVPVVTLTAAPEAVDVGGTSTLTWDSNGAQSCEASGGWSGSLATSGSQVVGPLASSNSYQISCVGPGGTAGATASVAVNAATAPTVDFRASAASVDEGQSVTLSWSTVDALSCTASGGWAGARPPSGAEMVGPHVQAATYDLTCTGNGGSVQSSVTVNVRPSLQLDAAETVITRGDDAELSWVARHADGCQASGAWSGSRPAAGSATVSSLQTDASFILNCFGPGGTVADSVQITVTEPPAPQVSLTVSDSAVDEGGATTLAWTSSNTTACAAGGAWSGSKSLTGSASTGPLTGPSTFTLTCDGPGGSSASSVRVEIRPSVTLLANPEAIFSGDTASLSWTARHSNDCVASDGWSGTRAVADTETVGPLTADTSFRLTCSGPGGEATDSVVVGVSSRPAPTISLQASPTQVSSGGLVTLSWTSTDATTCSASGGWNGSRALTGSETQGPLSQSTTYTLACDGPGGSAAESVTVQIAPDQPTLSLAVSDDEVMAGDTATLSWSSTGATSCDAGGGWGGSKPASGSELVGPLTVDSSFQLTCNGPGGQATGSVSVSVINPTAPAISLQASSTLIGSGDSVTLSWISTDATACSASGGWNGSRALNGSETQGPLSQSTTYTLACDGPGGSAVESVTVQIAPDEPTLSFTVSDDEVSAGDTATLSWSSTNVTSCDGSGAWTGSKPASGSEVVGPLTTSATYSLSCSNPSGNVVVMVSVQVIGTLTLEWDAPTENVDGSPLTDLAGFSIYYGNASQSYPNVVTINDPTSTSYTLDLPTGDYYMAMKAFDEAGNESAYSNEVVKSAQ